MKSEIPTMKLNVKHMVLNSLHPPSVHDAAPRRKNKKKKKKMKGLQ